MSCIKNLDDFKDFILVHKIWKKNFKGLKEDDFVMKGRVTIPNPAWRPPSYLKHWLTEDSQPSKNKQIYFSLLSKNIKYDENKLTKIFLFNITEILEQIKNELPKF